MQKKFGYLLAILIVIVGLIAATLMFKHTPPSKSSTTVYVDPPKVTCPQMDNFSISLKIDDVVGLYGLEIVFSWDSSLLECVNHTAHIPVENYPDGVLHELATPIYDTVDDTAGTYTVAYAAWDPAPVFNGNGTVFTMSFHVIEVDQCVLEIQHCKLVDKNANEIVCAVQNADFTTSG